MESKSKSNVLLISLISLMIVVNIGLFAYIYVFYTSDEQVTKGNEEILPIDTVTTNNVETETTVEIDSTNKLETNAIAPSNTTSTTPTQKIKTIYAKEVYSFAQAVFTLVTNGGNNYVPELHDDEVMKEVALYFGIRKDQAEDLYYAYAMNGNNKSIEVVEE